MDANTTSTVQPQYMYDYLNQLMMNPVAIVVLVVILAAYFIFFMSLGSSQSQENSMYPGTESSSNGASGGFLIMVIVVVLVVLISFRALKMFFNVDIVASIKQFFSAQPKIDIVVAQNSGAPTPDPVIKYTNQVFNVPGNYYGYEDAKALCQAYGSRLANYDDLEHAYDNGGEWCNYGWSEGQMALYPTQKDTYKTLQGIKGHEHDCGRPGINGGYIANPNVKFGVNCYGHKPKITEEEDEMMNSMSPYPKSKEDILLEKKVQALQNNIEEIVVSPFNSTTWSRL